MSTAPKHWEQDKEATVYIGNLDERATDALVWELMLQAGRIVNVHLPRDRVSQTHQGYGFVEFISEEDADYAARIMNQIRLFGKPIRVNKASADKQKTVEVGAELFVGNLDPFVDEKTLYDTFAKFGNLIVAPKIARDDANLSKGYGFISFSDFEASDNAIMHMHGRYLANKEITVQYAYKKDGKGERHGDEAERMLASQAKMHNVQPAIQPLPPQLLGAPMGPGSGIGGQGTGANNFPQGGYGGPPSAGGYGGPPNAGGYGGPPNGGMPMGMPPPGFQAAGVPPSGPPPRPSSATPLPPPPSGLPARPPPSQGGYNGPPNMQYPQQQQQGFQAPPPGGFPGQGSPQPMGMPPGFGAPPPGMPPPPGAPPYMQPGVYGRR